MRNALRNHPPCVPSSWLGRRRSGSEERTPIATRRSFSRTSGIAPPSIFLATGIPSKIRPQAHRDRALSLRRNTPTMTWRRWIATLQDTTSNEMRFDDNFFASTTEVIGKTTFELGDELEDKCMTVYVRTSSGKTISIKCDKMQKAVERNTSIPRGMTYLVPQGRVLNDKKTTEENTIGTETTIEMSVRILGGVEKWSDGHTRIRRRKREEKDVGGKVWR